MNTSPEALKKKPSADITQKRKELAKQIYDDNGHMITRNEFFTSYKELLTENGIEVPSDRIIRNYIKELKIVFSNGRDSRTAYSIYDELGEKLTRLIRQVRVSTANGYEKILCNSQGVSKSTLMEMILGISSNETSNLGNHSIVSLKFILFESGMERYICNVFKDECDYILYTASHDYCAELFFELEKLQVMGNKLYHIFSAANMLYSSSNSPSENDSKS